MGDCGYCHTKFGSEQELFDHVEDEHSEEATNNEHLVHNCSPCKLNFNNEDEYENLCSAMFLALDFVNSNCEDQFEYWAIFHPTSQICDNLHSIYKNIKLIENYEWPNLTYLDLNGAPNIKFK